MGLIRAAPPPQGARRPPVAETETRRGRLIDRVHNILEILRPCARILIEFKGLAKGAAPETVDFIGFFGVSERKKYFIRIERERRPNHGKEKA